MKKFGIVFNHDEREYSVYPEFEDGKIRMESIEFYQKKGIKVELSIVNVADKDAATRKAETMNKTYQYQNVEDTLGRYIAKE
jgi:hypothetical protein